MTPRPSGSNEPAPVVLLASPGASTRILYHALEREFGPVPVLLEAPMSRATLVRRRTRRLGPRVVLGQILFMMLAAPVLSGRGRTRAAEIIEQHGLDASEIDDGTLVQIPSVNSDEARGALVELSPKVVVISTNRIIGAKTLTCIDAPFLNVHAGITPQYRGVHGGYWALAEGRPHLVGTTVHVVDTGIDTGPIVAQETFVPTSRDSFATYPYLHLASGVPALVEATRDVVEGRPLTFRAPLSADEPSQLRFHPTLWGYLAARRR
jgi:folate-dependent phosphoribosylglycinamide formyltransferase PurN